MGDRITISFQKKDKMFRSDGEKDHFYKSSILYSHWGGTELVDIAMDFIDNLQKVMIETKDQKKINNPIDRFEPDILMVNFIRKLPSDNSEYNPLRDYDILPSVYRLLPDDSWESGLDRGHFDIDVTGCEDLKTKPKVLQGNEVVRVLA